MSAWQFILLSFECHGLHLQLQVKSTSTQRLEGFLKGLSGALHQSLLWMTHISSISLTPFSWSFLPCFSYFSSIFSKCLRPQLLKQTHSSDWSDTPSLNKPQYQSDDCLSLLALFIFFPSHLSHLYHSLLCSQGLTPFITLLNLMFVIFLSHFLTVLRLLHFVAWWLISFPFSPLEIISYKQLLPKMVKSPLKQLERRQWWWQRDQVWREECWSTGFGT